jgi:nucleotide sugar dehydrogenase
VRVRTTNTIVAPVLDRAGVRYDIAFCPERTLEGKALTELRQLPQIVGARDAVAAVRASQLFQFLTPTVVRVSDAETAEMIKLVDNAQRDVLFGYANEVARMCDAIGVSATEVIRAGKLGYPRTNLPMPGLVGGPCLEKDPHILAEGLREAGIEPEITVAARCINERQPREAVAYLRELYQSTPGFDAKPVITLLGLAFKGQPPTDDLRGTMARPVFAALREAFPGAQFRAYDAVVPEPAIRAFGVEPQRTLQEAFEGASLALILNNHPVFPAMPLSALSERMRKPAVVYDFWASFDPTELHLASGVGYVALGSHGRAILPTGAGETWSSTSSLPAAAAS